MNIHDIRVPDMYPNHESGIGSMNATHYIFVMLEYCEGEGETVNKIRF